MIFKLSFLIETPLSTISSATIAKASLILGFYLIYLWISIP